MRDVISQNHMSFLEKLNWRYATKKFDVTKKVSEEDTNKILEAIRLAPTSYGIQPFHVTIVEAKDIREELKKSAHGQSQITDAPLLLVFSARTDLVKRIDEYLDVISGGDAKAKEGLKQYEDMMKGALGGLDGEKAKAWAAKQAYIALGFGMAAAAELGIDSCPMEGFDAVAFNKILQSPENLSVQSALAIGYRAGDDKIRPKVRFPKDDIFSKK